MINGLHIEPTNICTLKCSGCARTRSIQERPQHWRNVNLDIDDILRFIDVDLQGKLLKFCGNYGDPIYHPEFIDMISAFKQRGAQVSITTNGSYKKSEWWQQLCEHLTQDDIVRFSIDGIPENFTMYRENADWESIKQGIEVCVDKGITTVWKFIPFSFNQNYIESARELARDLGITHFLLDPSDRYDEQTQHLIPADSLIGSRKSSQDRLINESKYNSIDPKCSTGKEHYISATGHYVPCCYLADHRFYYKTMFGKNRKSYSIKETTLSMILQDQQTDEFFGSLEDSPPLVCQYMCPKT